MHRVVDPVINTLSPRKDQLVRAAFALLLLVGLAAASLRVVAADDLFARMDPVRVQLMTALGLSEPRLERRAEMLATADRKFATLRLTTLVHILTGAGFLLLVPLQLSRRVRARWPAVHRFSGRVALLLAWASGLTGLFFGVRDPVGGPAEAVLVAAVGLLLLGATAMAFRHIRAGRPAQHREWMLRAIASAVAISSVRIVALPIDLFLAPRGVDPRFIFVLSLWVGWVATLAVAEWWIRRTRPRRGNMLATDRAQSPIAAQRASSRATP